jgi:hypothetical protein
MITIDDSYVKLIIRSIGFYKNKMILKYSSAIVLVEKEFTIRHVIIDLRICQFNTWFAKSRIIIMKYFILN